MRSLLLLFLALAAMACTSSRGFDRGALRSEVTQQREITDEEIKKAMEAKPQLPRPFKHALHFASPPKPEWYYRAQWLWTGEDKDRVLKALYPLRASGAVSELMVIPDAVIEGAGNKAVRLAAARVGADAVLMIRGTADLDRYNNALGSLYILLVTGAFIPGTEVDGLFIVNAAMWDVGNDFLYLGAEAEGLEHKTGPAFFVDDEQILKVAKGKALDRLVADVEKRLMGLAAK